MVQNSTSTVQSVNFRWPQGEDLNIQLRYKEGSNPANAIPVPLNAGYELRMDIVVPASRQVVHTLTSADNEIILGSGANEEPNIEIFVPRSLTLPGGSVFILMAGPSGSGSFAYDVFLRNTQTNRQVKVLKGIITVEVSNTLWA